MGVPPLLHAFLCPWIKILDAMRYLTSSTMDGTARGLAVSMARTAVDWRSSRQRWPGAQGAECPHPPHMHPRRALVQAPTGSCRRTSEFIEIVWSIAQPPGQLCTASRLGRSAVLVDSGAPQGWSWLRTAGGPLQTRGEGSASPCSSSTFPRYWYRSVRWAGMHGLPASS